MKEVIEALKKLNLPAHERLALEYVDDAVVDAEDIEDVILMLEETNIQAGAGIASDLMFTHKIYEWVKTHVAELDEAMRDGVVECFGYRDLQELVQLVIELGARDLAARLRGEI